MSDIVSPISDKLLPANLRAPDATRLTLAFAWTSWHYRRALNA